MLITIKEVAEKSGTKGPFKIVTTETGAKLYAFDKIVLPNLNVGTQVNVETKVSGNYTHIISAGAADAQPMQAANPVVPPIPAPQTPVQAIKPPIAPITPPPAFNRDNSIEAQVAFKGLVELDVAGKLDLITHAAIIQWAVNKMGLNICTVEEVHIVDFAKPEPKPSQCLPIKAVKK